MKKAIAITAIFSVCLTLLCVKLYAGIFLYSGGGTTINALTTSNLPSLYQVGTFALPNMNIYISAGTITNTNLVFITNSLTLVNTNGLFVLPQVYQFNSTNGANGALFAITNQSIPVYSLLSVSNGQAAAITNFSAVLQY